MSSSRAGRLRTLAVALTAAGTSLGTAVEVSARAPSVSVWYRSSDGCPSGPAFLARLKQLGHDADLAGVGDRVDFVVTLAADSPNSAGRLERQTERGTVAIRELQAPRCEDVAEALALNIELALQAPEPAAPAQAVSANPAPPGALGANHSSPDATAPRDGAAAGQQANALRLGADAGLATGVAPFVLPSAALFVELGAGGIVGRLSARGAYRRDRVEDSNLGVALLAARLDGCMFGWSASAFSVSPCVAGDLGLVGAGTGGPQGRTDQGLWASASGLLRGSLEISPRTAAEAQLGVTFPLLRYALGTPSGQDLFQIEPVSVEISLGVRWSP